MLREGIPDLFCVYFAFPGQGTFSSAASRGVPGEHIRAVHVSGRLGIAHQDNHMRIMLQHFPQQIIRNSCNRH
jgi:hypothetical protein